MDKVILISGKKRHGKNQVADFLEDKFLAEGYQVRKIALADPLKDAAGEIFMLNDEQIYGDFKETKDDRWGLTPREIMQKLGTEIGRAIHPEVWVLNLCFRVEKMIHDAHVNGDKIVIMVTDCRFPNEIAVPKKHFGEMLKTIRIVRPRLEPTAFDSHPSETSLDTYDKWDIVIHNDGGIGDLYRKCQALKF